MSYSILIFRWTLLGCIDEQRKQNKRKTKKKRPYSILNNFSDAHSKIFQEPQILETKHIYPCMCMCVWLIYLCYEKRLWRLEQNMRSTATNHILKRLAIISFVYRLSVSLQWTSYEHIHNSSFDEHRSSHTVSTSITGHR